MGTETRWFLLTTVDELHVLLYNAQAKEVTDADGKPIPTEADARYRVGLDQTGQWQAILKSR
jgi:hypothetical protein